MFLPSTITLKPGDTGDFVSELQRRLSAINLFDSGNVSGVYDELTTTAVRQFQGGHGLQVDGIAGPETIRRLNGAVSGSSDSGSSENNEEEKKEAERNTLKDSIINTMAAAPAMDPALMESAREETVKQDAPPTQQADNSAAIAQEREALAQQEAQANAAQAKLDQQSQMTEMLMKAAQAKQTGQQPEKQGDKMPAKEVVESEAIAQREQLAAQKEAIQNQPQQNQAQQPNAQELAAQKEQIAQQNQEAQTKEVAAKPQGMLQKLKDYIEAKLPTETVKEVVQTGTKMLKSGVQQASMPDDGAPQRAPETAQAKGQEQTAQIG